MEAAVPSAHAMMDNVTFSGAFPSLVFVTWMMMLSTFSVGNSFVGNDVGAPRIGTVSSPVSNLKNTAISSMLFERTSISRTMAAPFERSTNKLCFLSTKLTPLLIRSSVLGIFFGCVCTAPLAMRVLMNSISSQNLLVVVVVVVPSLVAVVVPSLVAVVVPSLVAVVVPSLIAVVVPSLVAVVVPSLVVVVVVPSLAAVVGTLADVSWLLCVVISAEDVVPWLTVDDSEELVRIVVEG